MEENETNSKMTYHISNDGNTWSAKTDQNTPLFTVAFIGKKHCPRHGDHGNFMIFTTVDGMSTIGPYCVHCLAEILDKTIGRMEETP